LPGGDHEILVGRVAAAGGRTGQPLVYWSGEYRALTAETPQSDQLMNASDGLAVAYHVLDVSPAEMLQAQNSIEPAIAALAVERIAPQEWDRLERLVDQSELAIDEPDGFNQLALAFHSALADASGNRVLQATLASLSQVQSTHYRDRGSPESARAAVEGHRRLLAVLRRGDPEAAREEMRKHLDAVGQHLQIG
jgi:DNA-binding FadR family transcriptional regulator